MLNNLRISQRFIAIMAMYWATFLALAVLALWGLFSGADQMSDIAERRLQAVASLNQLIKNNQANRTEVLLAFQHAPGSPLASVHDHELAVHLQNIDKRRKANDEAWPRMNASFASDDGKRLMEAADLKRRAWTAKADAAIEAVRRNDFSNEVMAAFLA